jgi:hypothetical protein
MKNDSRNRLETAFAALAAVALNLREKGLAEAPPPKKANQRPVKRKSDRPSVRGVDR